MKYLIFSPYSPQANAIAKYIKIHDKNAIIFGGSIRNEILPKGQKIYDAILKINTKNDCIHFDYVMPTTSNSTKVYTEWMHEFKVGGAYFNEDSLKVSNKLWLYQEAKKCNIHIPDTWKEYSEIPEDTGNVFFKPNFEEYVGIRTWVKNKNRIPERIKSNTNYHFQERITGRDVFGYGFISKDGNIDVSFIHKEICSMPKDGGNAVVLLNYCNSRLEELSSSLIRQIKYNGWGLIEWKYCNKRHDFVLMEINAKCWASMELALRNEPGFAKILFGINGKNENIEGIIWPSRLASTLFTNALIALKAIKENKLVLSAEKRSFISIITSLLPILWKDWFRKLFHKILVK